MFRKNCSVLLAFLLLLLTATCDKKPQDYPPAVQPVLKAVLKQGWPKPPNTNLPPPVVITPTASGWYDALPVNRLFIQFTGPQLSSDFEISVAGVTTKQVGFNDYGAQSAEDNNWNGNGWWAWHIDNVGTGSSIYFEVMIGLPPQKRVFSDTSIPIAIRNISNNPSLQGTAKRSDPLDLILWYRQKPFIGYSCAYGCGRPGKPPCCEGPNGCPKDCY
jgi:hypothetical protein